MFEIVISYHINPPVGTPGIGPKSGQILLPILPISPASTTTSSNTPSTSTSSSQSHSEPYTNPLSSTAPSDRPPIEPTYNLPSSTQLETSENVSDPNIEVEKTPLSQESYYVSSSFAILQVQKKLNEVLTTWKEAVGDREKERENIGPVGYGKGRGARMSVKDVEGLDDDGRNEGVEDDEESGDSEDGLEGS
ncbi:hypothetical protein TREMEDRAFT_60486 [Tremella mesenterica DSM 1558]|uniref:uncharacterized protein n=1 Tax=Tremella mesenterica (strain ATCC 24925 / CBS 8224 / DSM 1558 / NBRC 9311 / NRRL Y-6157 / RJB 2259-6 / UBC 559-6) TaxID=578456 RepID=UPI0003F49262|nr:uncharacterized protein TREMEDRAFT_60486 [Tremella mesenterica DSM 1558]EIW71563.1 hypothetical protein TREMEDRAFT_60486 [Tremella mesenterica DSM 1558]